MTVSIPQDTMASARNFSCLFRLHLTEPIRKIPSTFQQSTAFLTAPPPLTAGEPLPFGSRVYHCKHRCSSLPHLSRDKARPRKARTEQERSVSQAQIGRLVQKRTQTKPWSRSKHAPRGRARAQWVLPPAPTRLAAYRGYLTETAPAPH